MSDKEELKGGLSFDTTNAVAGITELNRNIKILDTGFKASAAGIQDWTGSVAGNETRIQSLNGIIDLQKQKVANLTAAYEKVKAETGATSSATGNLAIKVNNAQAALNKSQLELQQATTRLKELEVEENKQPSLWSKMASSAQSSGEKTSGILSTIKSHLSTIVGMIIGGFSVYTLKNLIEEGMEAEQTTAQLQAVLKSTGQQAGITVKAADDLASGLSKVTTFEDDTVKGVEALLLTFTKIGKNIFPQATEATLNMATAFKEDAKSAAIQLGKALNDPVAGVTSLRRVGVQLTDSQQNMIKSMVKVGDVAGAQKIILNELATETGNSARAAGSTDAGQYEILKNSLAEVREEIGSSLLPAFVSAAPAIEDAGDQIASAFTSHKDDIKNAVDGIVNSVKNLFGWITQHGPQVKDIIIGVGAAFIVFKIIPDVIFTVCKAIAALDVIIGVMQAIISPTTLLILGIVAALATLALSVDVMKNHWSDFANKFSADGKVIASAAGVVQSVLNSVIADINLGIAQTVENIGGNLLGTVASLLAGLSGIPGVGALLGSGAATVASAKAQIDDYYKSSVVLASQAQSEIGKSVSAVGDAWNKDVAAASKEAQDYTSTIKGLKNQITGFFTSTSSDLSKTASDAAKKAQEEAQKAALDAANKANQAGQTAGNNYSDGLGDGLASGVTTAKLSADEISASLGSVNTKPFENKLKSAIRQAGTDLTAAATAVTNLTDSEVKSVESSRDQAVNKLESQLAGLEKAETAQLNRTSSKNKSAVEDAYTTKKNAIENEVQLRKSQADKEIDAIKSVGQAYSDEISKELEAQKQFISSVNDLETNIEDALKKKYESEEKAQEDSLNKRLDKLSDWKDKAEQEVNDYYDNAEEKAQEAADTQTAALQKQIDALDAETEAEDRAAKLKEYTDKITDLQKQIQYSHDDYNKSQLQKSLDETTADYQKQIKDYATEDKKSALQTQIDQIKANLDAQKKAMDEEKKTELADIDEIYTKKKNRLDDQLDAVKAYYANCEESANLEAEAERMIMQNNQNEIITLLQSYSDQYKAAGTTLGDMLVQGFQPAIQQMKDMIASITASIENAKEAALEAKKSTLASESKSTTVNKSYTANNYIGSTKSTASEVSRATTNSVRSLALGMG